MSHLPRALSLLAVPLLLGGGADPGIVLVVDIDAFSLQARDLRADVPGPSLRVAIGSPSHPTPVGEFVPVRLVQNPAWRPGSVARSLGARPHGPSASGPLGVGKLPLEFEAIQIHAGADPLELGKPNSLGCVRVDDAGWTALVEWLEARETLHPWRESQDGDAEAQFRRPLRVVVR